MINGHLPIQVLHTGNEHLDTFGHGTLNRVSLKMGPNLMILIFIFPIPPSGGRDYWLRLSKQVLKGEISQELVGFTNKTLDIM
jgi:hypothetical protein